LESYVERSLAAALVPGQVAAGSWSRGRDVSCFTCRPAHRTLILSKRPSQRPMVSCAGLAPASR